MSTSFEPAGGPGATRDIYSIARLNREAKALLEGSFPLIWVEGEISNLASPASGHMYFTLKDAAAQVRCALFKGQARTLSIRPRDGMQVLARVRVTLYEGRGEFQLVVHHLEEAGEGALRRAFEALKARLAAEGLFDAEHKRPLPALPRRIGVITSPTGAAVRDILSTLARRFPAIPVLIYPVAVQGETAAAQIAAALRLAAERADCDVLILARGGGSLEDLRAFNDETVARAVHGCPIPVVCGVGHEIDYTIADLVADRRAPTPTAAAELVSPDQAEWLGTLSARLDRLSRLAIDRLRDRQQRVDWLGGRLVHPRRRLQEHAQRLDALQRRLASAQRARTHGLALRTLDLAARLRGRSPATRLQTLGLRTLGSGERLGIAMAAAVERQRQRLQGLVSRLHAVSPLATLERGYAILHTVPEHDVLRDAAQVAAGDRIEATLHRGRLVCVVEHKPDE
jgi:exodeoxyribonuclease VII large subunit